LYGVTAEFADGDQLVVAAHRVRDAGFSRFEAYSPLPMEELNEAVGWPKTWLPMIVLLAGVIGAISAFGFQWYTTVIGYPWDVGGRPHNSWQSYIPITFEFGVLCAALAGFFATLALNRLPWLYHPIFNTPGFERASRDRFFLCIESRDPNFAHDEVNRLLSELKPLRISEVPR
jgi:hypothetical protein